MAQRLPVALLIASLTVGPAQASDASNVMTEMPALAIPAARIPAAGTGKAGPRIIPKNVELHANGMLEFAFVDSLGHHQQSAPAVVIVDGKATRYRANSNGRFLVPIRKCGIVVVSDGSYAYGCRVWKHGTAPPRSLKNIAFVQKTDAVTEVRGNGFGTALRSVERLYGLAIVGLGGVALWQALDHDDAS